MHRAARLGALSSPARATSRAAEDLAQAWTEEIERRAVHVRAGESKGRPADEVFDRIEAKLRSR
jgi:hypothetical protein